jgi:uncharacterized membrane protein
LGVTGAGPLGVITAVAVAILGLATAVVRNGVLAGTPQFIFCRRHVPSVMGMVCNNAMSVKVKVNLSGKANYSVWILVLSVLALA